MERDGAGSFRSQVQPILLAGPFALAGPRAILEACLQEYRC